MSIEFQSAVLFVKDMKTARHFYEALLGQQVMMENGPHVVGYVGGFALWQVENAHQHIFGKEPAVDDRVGPKNLELYFETAELDTVWQRLADAGVTNLHSIREQPWGQRGFRVYDPDGYIVDLGEPMPLVIQRFLANGLGAAEIAERTSMPLNIVQQIIASNS